MSHSKTRRIIDFLASSGLFWGVVGFFILETLWIVFSAVYPMAFDEDFHFGIIKIYSHHWLPFLSGQPPGANAYGAVAHDPSYLYQYLMSFPYRFFELFTKDQTILVIWLRLINVGLFASALVLFRRVLLRAQLSKAFINVITLLFVLIPIVPLLAAEINYDNLTIVMVAWSCLLVERCIPQIQNKKIPLREFAVLAVVCLLGSIVKYAFLPVAAAVVIVLLAMLWVTFRYSYGTFKSALLKSYRNISSKLKVTLLILMLISLGLFSQRYFVNLTAYKTPIPKCDKVLTVDDCMSYGPWARTYLDSLERSPNFHAHVLSYVPLWLYGMWYRLFFSVNGNVPTPVWARYQTIAPLKLPSVTAIVIAVVSVIIFLLYWRKIFRGNWLYGFFFLLSGLYLIALFLDEYSSYAHSGQPVAVNGRYLLPILFPLLALVGKGWQLALRRYEWLKLALAVLAILLFLQGGGVLSFMIESKQTWYWPNHSVLEANKTAKRVAKDFVIFHRPLYIHSP